MIKRAIGELNQRGSVFYLVIWIYGDSDRKRALYRNAVFPSIQMLFFHDLSKLCPDSFHDMINRILVGAGDDQREFIAARPAGDTAPNTASVRAALLLKHIFLMNQNLSFLSFSHKFPFFGNE